MDTLHTASIVGFTLFIVSFALIAAAGIYYVASAWHAKLKKKPELYTVRWDKAGWLYLSYMMICALFAILYMCQYLDQGFWVNGLMLQPYLRWVMVAVAGAIEMGTLTYVMTYKSVSGQRFWVPLLYFLSLALFIGATLSITSGQRLNLMVWSIAAFVFSIALLFFPDNLIWDAEYEMGAWQILFSEKPWSQRHNIVALYTYAYRCVILAQVVVVYVAYVIIWFLTDSNQFSELITTDNSMIAYVVFDLVGVLPFAIFLLYATFAGLTRKFVATRKDAQGHTVSVY